MRYSFQAVDEHGRVTRGVLKAESEEQARELLLDENVFPKQLEPAAEDEKVTWAPTRRIKEQYAARSSAGREEKRPVRAIFETTLLFGTDEAPLPGKAGLTEQDEFVFNPRQGEPFNFSREEVEVAAIRGFPIRVMRITMLNGRMYEFQAGMIIANGSAKEIARTLSPKGKGKKK